MSSVYVWDRDKTEFIYNLNLKEDVLEYYHPNSLSAAFWCLKPFVMSYTIEQEVIIKICVYKTKLKYSSNLFSNGFWWLFFLPLC